MTSSSMAQLNMLETNRWLDESWIEETCDGLDFVSVCVFRRVELVSGGSVVSVYRRSLGGVNTLGKTFLTPCF